MQLHRRSLPGRGNKKGLFFMDYYGGGKTALDKLYYTVLYYTNGRQEEI